MDRIPDDLARSGRGKVDRFFDALGAFGAGVQGKAPEYFAAQEQLSEQRRTALLQDARKTLMHLQAGNVDSASKLLQNRMAAIQKLGGDPSDTAGIINLLQQGPEGINQAISELSILDQAAVANGAMQPLQKHVGVAGGFGIQYNPASGQYSAQAMPEVQAAMEAQEQARAAHTSAKTEILPGGLTLFARSDGTTSVVDASGREIVDPQERVEALAKARQQGLDEQFQASQQRTAGDQQARSAQGFFERIEPLRESISQSTEAIALLEGPDSANTGPIMRFLPSIRAASQNLDSLQKRMGLNVIQNTTFGALSEKELRFALETAMPDNMQPETLREWFINKRDAQEKMLEYIQRAAIHLGNPNNNLTTFLEQEQELEEMRKQQRQSQDSNGVRFLGWEQ
jgi:hypothetical protein